MTSASAPADPSAPAEAGALSSEDRPVLQFASPRRGRPPLHFADLEPDERRDAVARTGQPGFRAKQLAVQYFGRLTSDLDTMTDIPASARAALAPLLPPLLT
jgi:23S rRNA (adenine2503-C2)-methyltransferase